MSLFWLDTKTREESQDHTIVFIKSQKEIFSYLIEIQLSLYMSGLTRSHTDVPGQREKLERGSQGRLCVGFEGGAGLNLAELCDLEKFQGIILDGEEAKN